MHPFFAPLSPFETSILLTCFTLGSEPAPEALQHLGEPMQSRVRERAEALLAMPQETRTPLLVQELKALMAHGGQSGLELVDPTWVLHHMRGETPRMCGTILLGLPAPLMRSVLKRLPAAIRRALPPKSELQAIRPRLAQDVRTSFSANFAPMPASSSSNVKGLHDILFLERQELYHLIRDLGLTELGLAFAAVEKMALVELCRRLEKKQAHELIAAVQSASQVDVPDASVAQHFLSKIVVNFENTEEFLQKSGLWRLASACTHEDDAWCVALSQRLPRQAGTLFVELLARAKDMLAEQTDEVRLRLHDAILVRVVQLARKGDLSAHWGSAEVAFHDTQGCLHILRQEGTQSGQKPQAG